jgi:uncharacterized protein YeaO (DUF488 family)
MILLRSKAMSRKIAAANVRLKRAYDAPVSSDGTRILIDRLWPRGVRKTDAAIDRWTKDIAPSTMLRKWFGHDPARWQEFQQRYTQEIHRHRDRLEELRTLAHTGRITLVFAAHDKMHNDAVVLRDVLLGRTAARKSRSASAYV